MEAAGNVFARMAGWMSVYRNSEVDQKIQICQKLIDAIATHALAIYDTTYMERAHIRNSIVAVQNQIRRTPGCGALLHTLEECRQLIKNRDMYHLNEASAFSTLPREVHCMIASLFPYRKGGDRCRALCYKLESIFGEPRESFFTAIMPAYMNRNRCMQIRSLPPEFLMYMKVYNLSTRLQIANFNYTYNVSNFEDILPPANILRLNLKWAEGFNLTTQIPLCTALKSLDLKCYIEVPPELPFSCLSSLQHLNLAHSIITEEQLQAVFSLTRLQSLHLGGCPLLTDKNISALSGLTNLKKLKIPQLSKVSKFEGVESLTRLEKLDLSRSRLFTDIGLKGIPFLANLRVLIFCKNDISDGLLIPLNSLTALQKLHIIECCRITEGSLKNLLSKLTSLRELVIHECGYLTDRLIEGIVNLQQLWQLGLGKTLITDDGVAQLASLTNLQHLSLVSSPKIGHLGHLSVLQDLRFLGIHACKFLTDDGIAALEWMSQLKTLYFEKCHSLTALPPLPLQNGVTQLRIKNCRNLTDKGFQQLHLWSNLRTLMLDQSEKITDAGLSDLGRLTNLRTLHLTNCPHITNLTIKNMTSLERLRKFDCAQSNLITTVWLAILKTLPKVEEIIYGDQVRWGNLW